MRTLEVASLFLLKGLCTVVLAFALLVLLLTSPARAMTEGEKNVKVEQPKQFLILNKQLQKLSRSKTCKKLRCEKYLQPLTVKGLVLHMKPDRHDIELFVPIFRAKF